MNWKKILLYGGILVALIVAYRIYKIKTATPAA